MATRREWDPLKELLTVQKRMNKLFESALVQTDFDTQEGVASWTPVCDSMFKYSERLDGAVVRVQFHRLE